MPTASTRQMSRPCSSGRSTATPPIAQEGLRGDYGANIGSILLSAYGDGVHNRAKAWAAAGSDGRMNGCELPVVINSGSGNQGLTASLPVIVYAQELGGHPRAALPGAGGVPTW